MSLLNATSRISDPAQPAPSPAPGGTGVLIDKTADQPAADLAGPAHAAPGNDDQDGAGLSVHDRDRVGLPGRDPDCVGLPGRDPAGPAGRDQDCAGPAGRDPDGVSSTDPDTVHADPATPDRTGLDYAVLADLDPGGLGSVGDGSANPGSRRSRQNDARDRLSDFGRVDLSWANPGGVRKPAVAAAFGADPDGYPLTGRLSGALPGVQPDDRSSPEEVAEPCVIAVVTVEPTSRERDAVRLPLVIAAVLAAPGRA